MSAITLQHDCKEIAKKFLVSAKHCKEIAKRDRLENTYCKEIAKTLQKNCKTDFGCLILSALGRDLVTAN